MVKEKIKAALLHASVTLMVAILAWVLVYKIWYPGEFAAMSQGANIYALVLVVEIVLGPLMSLVIFNSHKSRRELIVDYSLVGLVQLGALLYGLYVVSVARPVYLVYVKDRIEVVTAADLKEADVDRALEEFRRLPWFGGKLICVEFPSDPKESNELLFSSLEGKDIQFMPKYFRACSDGQIISGAFSKAQYYLLGSANNTAIEKRIGERDFSWMPIVTRFGAWTAIFPEDDVSLVIYLNTYPFMK